MTLQEQKQMLEIFTEKMKETVLKKGDDYAGQADRLKNFKLAGNIAGDNATKNCLHAISTKVARLSQLLNSGSKPKNESVEDSLLDLANYSFLMVCILSEYNQEKIDYDPNTQAPWDIDNVLIGAVGTKPNHCICSHS
jgi:hypothetical protein